MRALATVGFFIFLAGTAYGQEQERSLVNRLLKPDMSLQNSAQNKKFTAVGESTNKHATVASFYFENKTRPAKFSGTRDFQSREFNSRLFLDGKRQNQSSDKKLNGVATYSQASLSQPIRNASDRDNLVTSREFAGQRTFVEQGKSQKSLDRHNPPMTIEQVRELLNKNK